MSRQLDITAIRARLAASGGKKFWRSLDELANTDEFQELVDREFPHQAGEMRDPVTRRTFMKLMGASLALGGLSGCQFGFRQPQEKIVPYVRVPDGVVAGKPLFFATTMPFDGYGIGVLVESHEGRPTKIEGNPKHPASLGGSNAFVQSSILTMYDPDRSQAIMNNKQPSDWAAFSTAIGQALNEQRGNNGAGLRILTGTVTSPTLASQIQQLLTTFSGARWYQYDAVGRDNIRIGATQAFGSETHTVYRFETASVVLSVDSDFTFAGVGSMRYARDLFGKRRVRGEEPTMNRLYVVESTPTLTGSMADHRLALRPSQIESMLRTVAVAVGAQGVAAPAQALEGTAVTWAATVAKDLQASRGTSVVVVGDEQPAVVHAIGHAINQTLGNVGQTVIYTDPVEVSPNAQQAGIAGLRALSQEMDGGQVSMLVMIDTNPVFTAPADVPFATALAKVATRVHLGLYDDETADQSTWHVNGAHYLENWGDARAFDGTASVIQPLIAPLYNGKTAYELIALLNGQADAKPYDLVRAYWQSQQSGGDFELFWQTAVRDGVIANTALPPKSVTLAGSFDTGATAAPAAQALEIALRPDPTLWDGTYANNGWMQEVPKPLTKITWDNAVLVSPTTAEKLGVVNGNLVNITFGGRKAQGPVWITPGHVNDSVTVHFGYGRTRVGRVGQGTGFNAYPLRSADAPWTGVVELAKAGGNYQLVTTQDHSSMEGRDIIRTGTLEAYAKDHNFFENKYGEHHGGEEAAAEAPAAEAPAASHEKPYISLYPKIEYKGYAWGMTIDLNACNGCNACVVACVAENNTPVVGKDQVSRGRVMHWMRIDRYYEGDLETASAYNMPMACQQCENAPCESVCPVGATVHDSEGLNNMVYNRCVGTKYCSNNCPFKVRRFNFLQYTDETTPSLKLQRNPEVTVRSRGVMEKCTYCVQRINGARIEAEKGKRKIADGEIVTACQQACPSAAITFGDINDPNSAVAKLKQEAISYTLLDNLNVHARTSYMPRLRNINPELESE